MSHHTHTVQFAHQAHKPPIAHIAQRTAPPLALPSQQHCLRTFCPTRAAPVALSVRTHCSATLLLRHRLHAGTQSERPTARRAAHQRRPLTAVVCLSPQCDTRHGCRCDICTDTVLNRLCSQHKAWCARAPNATQGMGADVAYAPIQCSIVCVLAIKAWGPT